MRTRPPRRDERGFALFTVLVFAFLIVITGIAFFAMSTYETKAAMYREDSSEAFYLADAGIDRARSNLLNDAVWRGPITPTSLGAGTYQVATADSVYPATGDSALYVYSEGHARGATRAVEAWFNVRPPEQTTAMVVMRDIDTKGNLCITGHVHANGDADFGPHDTHLKCGGTYSDHFEIRPAMVYTEPDSFPNTTYYFVHARNVPPGAHPVASIYDRNWTDITPATNPFTGILGMSVSHGDTTFAFTVTGADVYGLFGDGSAIFPRNVGAGDSAVVVNFGEYTGTTKASIELHQTPGDPSITATIINTRYTGTPAADRLDWNNWYGGEVQMQTACTFEPRNGIALITHDMNPSNAQVALGTPAHPALTYVTRDVVTVNGDLSITGAIIVLRDWHNQGGPSITWNPGFIPHLPGFLGGLQSGSESGVTELIDWREVVPKS